MGQRTTDDSLEGMKIARAEGEDGAAPREGSQKARARALVLRAEAAFPGGLPDDSPFAAMSRDQLYSEANRLSVPYVAMMAEAELRLALQLAHREKQKAPAGHLPVGGPTTKPKAPPPVPVAPVTRKIIGLKPSKTDVWRVGNAAPKTVSIGGNLTVISPGKVIRGRQYTDSAINSMIQQGIDLVPVDEV